MRRLHSIVWKAQSQNFLWFIELNMVTYIPFNERLCALFRSLSGRPEYSSHTCCFILMYQKRGLLHTLLHRSFSIFQDNLFWNRSFEDYPHEKQLSPEFHWFAYYFLMSCIHLKLLFRMYLKEVLLLSCCSCEVLCFKFEIIFKNCLMVNWHLVI